MPSTHLFAVHHVMEKGKLFSVIIVIAICGKIFFIRITTREGMLWKSRHISGNDYTTTDFFTCCKINQIYSSDTKLINYQRIF